MNLSFEVLFLLYRISSKSILFSLILNKSTMENLGLIAISAALIIMSGVYCIAKIVATGYNAMARQPEIADKIKSSFIIPLGFVESGMLMGVLLCGYMAYRA